MFVETQNIGSYLPPPIQVSDSVFPSWSPIICNRLPEDAAAAAAAAAAGLRTTL